ncbi:phosphoribosylanthranilate isomerase [Salinisphaera sp. Q1T1-3]|uniref:phosphoribosylanthranilate isomerase n=1 Tax=Salinisphaera sp. Q1T1-3 TaxID=2321229 RepID=UPI001F3FDFA2|nr:phosphoribosylanthranilate isomerase [Salinisphaera sp. Q1T1-3]
MRTKICGVGSTADARAAVAAGADALGLSFAHNSTRRLDLPLADEISRAVGPFVSRVGLFMDDDASMVNAVLAAVSLDMLQFHGDESPAFCRRFGKPYIKAVAMGEGDVSLPAVAARYPDAAALLLDGNRRGQPGGRGETFDWGVDFGAVDVPVIVAGGLHAGNVGQAIASLAPYAVDVSSGVEATRGVKSTQKMQAFINAVLKAGQT